MGAVSISKMRKRRVRSGASCADIFRNIRNTRNKTTVNIKYDHVDGHMDKYLLFSQMTLAQQMNYVCDNEVNKAAERSIQHNFSMKEKQLLPGEDGAVFVGGKKLTSDLSGEIRLEASREKAKEVLINE